MKVVQVPWFVVEQGSTVVVDGLPWLVASPPGPQRMLRADDRKAYRIFGGEQSDTVTVLVPETDDAVRILSGQFTVEILEEI